jgi:hypothetical protein
MDSCGLVVRKEEIKEKKEKTEVKQKSETK